VNDVIDTLVAAANDHDPDAMVALFHAEYRSLQPAHPGRAFVGRAQVGPRSGWKVAAIEPGRIQTRYYDDTDAPAWLATVERT
jgi:hypothetical protein